jgi:glycosyltransferase involved in cell wall biosynthesis
MHLVVNAIGIKHSGGAAVLLDFLQAAIQDGRISQISIACSPRSTRNFELTPSEKCRVYEYALAEKSYAYRLLTFRFLLARQSRRLQADRFVCLVGVSRTDAHIPQATFIQQSLPFAAEALQRLSVPQRLRLALMKQLMRGACRSASTVIVQTPTMRQWVAHAFDLPPDKVVSIKPTPPPYPPRERITNENISIEAMQRVPRFRRLLYMGNDAAYKNLDLIVTGMRRLRAALPGATLFLTLPEKHRYARLEGIVCLGYLTGVQKWQAIELADVLIMPSLVETVGLPMLEAFSMGVPVMAADRPYAHDVCGQAALFFDPLSEDDFVRAAGDLLQDSALRAHLIEQGHAVVSILRQGQPYTRMVDQVLEPGCWPGNQPLTASQSGVHIQNL